MFLSLNSVEAFLGLVFDARRAKSQGQEGVKMIEQENQSPQNQASFRPLELVELRQHL
jgi:hypothetical protein